MVYLLLMLFPVAIAASCFVVRRQSGLAIGAGLICIVAQLILVAQIPVDEPVRLLGLTLNLSNVNRLFMIVFVVTGGLLLVGARSLPHGENFVPILLLTISQICALLLLQNLFIVTLLLITTGLTAVLAIVDLPAGASSLVGTRSIAAALKYLVLMTVAGGLMYVAFVFADIFRPGELPGRISLSRFILSLLAVSFALRLALIPFHTWLTDLFTQAEPLVSGLIITLLNTASLLVLILAFQSFPTLLIENEQGLAIMRIGGVVSACLAGLLTINQNTLRRGLAYLILFDCGMIFYGLTAGSELGLAGALYGALNQALAITLICVSLALLERPDGRPPIGVRRDLLRRWPVAGAGLLVRGLALLGVPPFSGFGGRLLLFQAAAAHGPLELGLLVLATLLAGLGLAQIARERLLGPSEDDQLAEPLLLGETELDRPTSRRLPPEPLSAANLTMLLLLVSVAIGLYPQPLLETIETAVRGLAFIRTL